MEKIPSEKVTKMEFLNKLSHLDFGGDVFKDFFPNGVKVERSRSNVLTLTDTKGIRRYQIKIMRPRPDEVQPVRAAATQNKTQVKRGRPRTKVA